MSFINDSFIKYISKNYNSYPSILIYCFLILISFKFILIQISLFNTILYCFELYNKHASFIGWYPILIIFASLFRITISKLIKCIIILITDIALINIRIQYFRINIHETYDKEVHGIFHNKYYYIMNGIIGIYNDFKIHFVSIKNMEEWFLESIFYNMGSACYKIHELKLLPFAWNNEEKKIRISIFNKICDNINVAEYRIIHYLKNKNNKQK